MALKVLLSNNGPGYGTITISGAELPSGTVEIAIQRNLDEKYLGQNQQWHTTPHWHPVQRRAAEGGELGLQTGPEIIDGIVACSNMPLQIRVRTGAFEDRGVLRTKGQLLGSHAASTVTPAEISDEAEEIKQQEHEEQKRREQEERQRQEQEARRLERQRQQQEQEQRRREAEIQVQRKRRARLSMLTLLLLVLLILGGIVIGLWTTSLTTPNKPSTPSSPNTSSTPKPPPEQPKLPQEPLLQGRKFVQNYLNRDPKPIPQEMYTTAQQREPNQDCEAAMILYNFAANANADMALALAKRYDPDSFQTSTCIQSPDADTAAHWYENPAAAGNTDAQRQLGKILTSQHTSGAVYDRGIEWLQQAAAAGDEKAQALLDERAKP